MTGFNCRWCQFRHGGCPHNEPIENCKDFRTGKCYSCKYYYGKKGNLTEIEKDAWFRRGCEIWCPSSLFCHKRKRLSRKRKKKLKKMGMYPLGMLGRHSKQINRKGKAK